MKSELAGHVVSNTSIFFFPTYCSSNMICCLYSMRVICACHIFLPFIYYRLSPYIFFRDTRSSVLEESLHKLGVEKLSKDDVQKMQWEILEAKIGNWIHYMRIAVRDLWHLLKFLFVICLHQCLIMLQQVKLLFAGERKVCDEMFEGFDSLGDQCFAEVTRSSVLVLLSFGEAIANSKRSPEKLFVLLDMYEIMRELHSEV